VIAQWRNYRSQDRRSGATPKVQPAEFSGGMRYNNTSAVWHTNSSGFPEICTSGTIRPSPLYMRVHRRRDIYARRVGGRSLQVEGPQGLSRFPMLLVHAYIGTINRRASLSSMGLVKNSARNSKRMGKRRSGRVGRISKIIVYSGARRSTRIIVGCSKRRVMSVNHTSCNKPPRDWSVYLDRSRVALGSFTERGIVTFVNFMRNDAPTQLSRINIRMEESLFDG